MKSALRQGAIGLILVAAGVATGGLLSPAEFAHGEVRGTAPPPPFQSGGQLSVPLLKEIAVTLRQIDGRLERLEAAAQKMQAARGPAQTGN